MAPSLRTRRAGVKAQQGRRGTALYGWPQRHSSNGAGGVRHHDHRLHALQPRGERDGLVVVTVSDALVES
jgi:hypothetical protein